MVFEDILGAGHDGDGTPARVANDRMAAQALAIAVKIDQHPGHGRVGRVIVKAGLEALAEFSLVLLRGIGLWR